MEVTETTLLGASCSVVLALIVIVLVDFLRLPRSRYGTWTDTFLLYLLIRVISVFSFFRWRQFVSDSTNLLDAQERFVLGQVRANASSAYGRDHNFSSIASLADFRRTQPLTSYSDYEPYVARVAAGETTAMFGDGRAPLMFGRSSGTTGQGKRIPFTKAGARTFGNATALLAAALPGYRLRTLRLQLSTFCAPRWRQTAAGTRVGSVLAWFLLSRPSRVQSTLPDAALEVSNATAASHVGLLFALRDEQVEQIKGTFAAHLLGLLQYLEQHWRRLVSDLRSGRLGEGVPVTGEVRTALDALLRPEPDRATQLETEFSKGFDSILPRIFPHLRYITARCSGSSMAVYKRRCMAYAGNVPIYSNAYVCTEGFIGINIRPGNERPGYALMPEESYVEFLPVNGEGHLTEGEEPLQAQQVQLGKMYEVVLTSTSSGFYRYRLGDVVEVVGFFKQIPQIDFLFRTGQMLNVHFEKLSEASFTAALRSTVDRWPGLRLKDFTAAESVLVPDQAADQPHYLVFIETEGGTPTDQQRNVLDETLCDQHYVYKSFRVKNAIGAMKVIPVSDGTFSEYRAHLESDSSVFGQQFKQPRVLRTEQQVQFFLDRRLPSQ